MRARLGIALAFAALGSGPALAEGAVPPDLDCTQGFVALRKWADWLPGAKRETVDGRDVVTVTEPDVWRVVIAFTEPGQTAHPAVTLRKFLKQVTGVWTAQSKACGYGDQVQFSELVSEMKAEDTRLTNVSRDEVDQQKRAASPLGGP